MQRRVDVMPESSTTFSATARAPIPAWLLSFLLHCSLFTVAAILFRATPRGIPEPGRGAGIVLVKASAAGKVEYFAEEGAGGNAHAGGSPLTGAVANTTRVPNPLPGMEQLPQSAGPQLPSGLANLGLPGEDSGLPGAGGFTQGGPQGNVGTGIKGEAIVEVFGVQGSGSRFVYVFDRSLSMSGYQGRPLAAAQRELIKSLESLGSVHQFQMVFYNEEPKVFGARPGQSVSLVFGNDENKKRAATFVNGITADGGTRHMEALVKALSMGPDVIFFLTDADDPQLSEADLARLRQRNRAGTVINCIEYGAGASQEEMNFLKRLAKQNRGQHVYIDVTRLPK